MVRDVSVPLGEDVQLVRFLYCDFSGVTRGKAVHAKHLARKLREGVGLTRAQMAMNLLDELCPVDGMEPVGEIRLIPDLATLRTLPWDRRSASVYCDQVGQDGEDWGACPRGFLRHAAEKLAAVGIEVQASFENEFYLAREAEGRYAPFDHAPVYSAIGLDLSADVMHDIVEALEEQGLDVAQSINEYGAGQHEISIAPATPLAAGDRQMRLRDTVRGVALRHGLLASFAAKPFPAEVGSGAHIHFSLWRGGKNLMYDPANPGRLSETGLHFVGGILSHLRALTALTCPNYNSYRRLQPHAWASAYVSWGYDNRETAVRVASPFRGSEEETFNAELKTSDPSANPYLALGGLLLAGLDGLERGVEPGAPCLHDPALLESADREALGILPLPPSMREALQELEADRVLMDGMGDFLSRAYLTVRRSEEQAFSAQDTDFEISRHFYRF